MRNREQYDKSEAIVTFSSEMIQYFLVWVINLGFISMMGVQPFQHNWIIAIPLSLP